VPPHLIANAAGKGVTAADLAAGAPLFVTGANGVRVRVVWTETQSKGNEDAHANVVGGGGVGGGGSVGKGDGGVSFVSAAVEGDFVAAVVDGRAAASRARRASLSEATLPTAQIGTFTTLTTYADFCFLLFSFVRDA
jgi:hypothetical protein